MEITFKKDENEIMSFFKYNNEMANIDGVSVEILEYLSSILTKSIEDEFKKNDIRKKIKENLGKPLTLFRTFYKTNGELFYMQIMSMSYITSESYEDLENFDVDEYIESLLSCGGVWNLWSDSQDYDCFSIYAENRKVKNSTRNEIVEIREKNLINEENLLFDFKLIN
ncbi:Uncharacterised protein [[Clostridium] sordellii]|uniref:hypothetical protein n=1 Tax=Paraclostridium sordellii TaxID=1505 RepID=UPI0005E6B74F|nr:hypothetical protein [Paeniclostridium sordellii]CEN25453.1 Uncharacterised protein [[Clostridium] sordellii] [Paeniclostridium sordellii]